MNAGSAYYASQLRQELSLRNRAFALQRRLSHVESFGGMPVTVYQPHPTRRRHGNFFDESYAAMLAIPEWRKRLDKVHTQAKSSLPNSGRGWKELDSSMSRVPSSHGHCWATTTWLAYGLYRAACAIPESRASRRSFHRRSCHAGGESGVADTPLLAFRRSSRRATAFSAVQKRGCAGSAPGEVVRRSRRCPRSWHFLCNG